MLTKKFVKLTQEAQDGTLDLKKNCGSVGGTEKESFMGYAHMLLNKRIELLTLEGSHKVGFFIPSAVACLLLAYHN